jgi:hypothetical protein
VPLKPVSWCAHELVRRLGPLWSELPLRIASTGFVHRDEPREPLHGLFRLRQFSQGRRARASGRRGKGSRTSSFASSGACGRCTSRSASRTSRSPYRAVLEPLGVAPSGRAGRLASSAIRGRRASPAGLRLDAEPTAWSYIEGAGLLTGPSWSLSSRFATPPPEGPAHGHVGAGTISRWIWCLCLLLLLATPSDIIRARPPLSRMRGEGMVAVGGGAGKPACVGTRGWCLVCRVVLACSTSALVFLVG